MSSKLCRDVLSKSDHFSPRKVSEPISPAGLPPRKDKLSSGESLAMVKMSQNPAEDFRKSMYEMMRRMRRSDGEEMEALLHCYLSLNSPQLHDLIEEVFCDVWCALF
jgi:uncharacterized protein (TIGR01568 family)